MSGFKLQALNYAGHAIAALKLMQQASSRHRNSVDAKTCEWLVDEIQKAVHFVVPLDGRIFDDGLKGIKDTEIHLPFPSRRAQLAQTTPAAWPHSRDQVRQTYLGPGAFSRR